MLPGLVLSVIKWFDLKVMGYGIFFVLLALSLLAVAVWLMGLYFQHYEKNKGLKVKRKEGLKEEKTDDERLKAAIVAAVATCMAESKPLTRPRAKPLSKTEEASRWETMSRYELMEEP